MARGVRGATIVHCPCAVLVLDAGISVAPRLSLDKITSYCALQCVASIMKRSRANELAEVAREIEKTTSEIDKTMKDIEKTTSEIDKTMKDIEKTTSEIDKTMKDIEKEKAVEDELWPRARKILEELDDVQAQLQQQQLAKQQFWDKQVDAAHATLQHLRKREEYLRKEEEYLRKEEEYLRKEEEQLRKKKEQLRDKEKELRQSSGGERLERFPRFPYTWLSTCWYMAARNADSGPLPFRVI